MSQTSDVIVVGSGAAGMTASIEAAGAGARVLMLEAQAECGGAAATAGAGTCIAGSPLQDQLGVQDSATLALEDWLAWGGPEADAVWAQRYLEASVPELFVWLAELGVEWVTLHDQEGNRVPRWHAPRGGGYGLMEVLHSTATHLPIDVRTGARVADLVLEGGRVVGVTADLSDGRAEELRAPAVLIASGGFNNNLAMVREHAAATIGDARVLLGGGHGALGTGHHVLEAVGAKFVQLDAIWFYPYGTPDPNDPTGTRGLVLRGLDGEVWVNGQGLRFHDESKRGGKTGGRALLAQSPPTCWAIIDARMAGGIRVADPAFRQRGADVAGALEKLLSQSPFIHSGATIANLASAAGIDRVGLTAAIARHNGLIESGATVDPEFGRPLAGLQPLQTPPFYAIQFFPLARKNFGGVRTDLECRVLRPDGTSIPGLFAAGEVAGMAGGHINGRAGLEGTMIGPSLFSGRVAGQAMVDAATTSLVSA